MTLLQTRNPFYRAHSALTKQTLAAAPNMNLLIHPVVGITEPGDVDHHTRGESINATMPTHPQERTALPVFPPTMYMDGPCETIWRCLILKNYGTMHFILDRDYAGPGAYSTDKDFYEPVDMRYTAVPVPLDMGMHCLSFKMQESSPNDNRYCPSNAVPAGTDGQPQRCSTLT